MINFAESKWYNLATAIWEVIALGFLWTLFSVLGLGITMGASTTALYYVATKKVSKKEDDYLTKAFWNSFKENFVQSTIVFLILIAVSFVVWFNLILLPYLNLGGISFLIRLALFFVTAQLFFVTSVVFAVIARFEMSVFNALKAAFALANRHLLMTISNLILLLVILYLAFLSPVVLLFMMGIYGYFSSFFIVKMFRKINPDFDEVATNEDTELTEG